MRLDRNINPNGRGKYALIKLRKVALSSASIKTHRAFFVKPCAPFIEVPAAAVDFGDTPDSDFFVIRLRDKYAQPALEAYAMAARADGEQEYANEVAVLAIRARNHKGKHKPD